jgi:hypothetical protein
VNLEHVTNGTAVGAVTSYFWLPTFHSLSAACAEIVPVLGALWLLIQIGFKFYDRYSGKP